MVISISSLVPTNRPCKELHSRRRRKATRLSSLIQRARNNTERVIDLRAGKRVLNIPGQSKPQSVFYSRDSNRLFVDEARKIYTGTPSDLLTYCLPLGEDVEQETNGLDMIDAQEYSVAIFHQGYHIVSIKNQS